MGLIKRVAAVTSQHNDIKVRYTDVFTGLGCIEGGQHIKLKPDAQSAIHPPGRVPVALRNKLTERMENFDVIERVVERRAWVNRMVTIWKPEKKKVRICIDPKDLNAAIEREHYPMTTTEEMVTRTTGAKVFTTPWLGLLANKIGQREFQIMHFQQYLWKICLQKNAIQNQLC